MVNNGSVASVVNNRDANRTQTYTYDPLNRLASAEVPATAPNPWKQTFAYDIWANLLSIGAASGTPPRTLSVAVGANNRISSAGFSYDAAGNMTADGGGSGTHTYAWDSENWLKSVDSGATTYTYDAIHWRAKKQTGSTGKLYWYDVNTGEVLMETALDGSSPREFIYFAGQRVARRNPDGTVNYRFLDHLGSLRVMTSDSGSILQELDYDPFGYSVPVVSNPATDDPYQFISKERDAESLNDHYWFRQYSPRLARWCSGDPVMATPWLPQSLNRYTYVVNNPTNLTDRTGRFLSLCGLQVSIIFEGNEDTGGGFVQDPWVTWFYCNRWTPFPAPFDLPEFGFIPPWAARKIRDFVLEQLLKLARQLKKLSDALEKFGDPEDCSKNTIGLQDCTNCCNTKAETFSLICGGLATDPVSLPAAAACLEGVIQWLGTCLDACMRNE